MQKNGMQNVRPVANVAYDPNSLRLRVLNEKQKVTPRSLGLGERAIMAEQFSIFSSSPGDQINTEALQ